MNEPIYNTEGDLLGYLATESMTVAYYLEDGIEKRTAFYDQVDALIFLHEKAKSK